MYELKADFSEANLKTVISDGYFLKPLSNGQIGRDWSREMLDAYLELGEKYPDIAGEIYIVAKHR